MGEPQPAGAAPRANLTPAQLVIVIAGAVALIGSFLPWVDVSGYTQSAWSNGQFGFGFFPLFTWVGLFGLVMGGHIALTSFGSVSLPERILDFTWRQIHLVLAVFTVLLTVSWLIAGDNQGIGFYLSLLASIGLLVGAFMLTDDDLA